MKMTEVCWIKSNQQVKSKVRLPEGSSENSARKIPIILLLVYLPTRQQMVKNLYLSRGPTNQLLYYECLFPDRTNSVSLRNLNLIEKKYEWTLFGKL